MCSLSVSYVTSGFNLPRDWLSNDVVLFDKTNKGIGSDIFSNVKDQQTKLRFIKTIQIIISNIKYHVRLITIYGEDILINDQKDQINRAINNRLDVFSIGYLF